MDAVEELLHRMNVTKGSQFNAAKRLEGRDRKMALLIALASALMIGLTFISIAYKLPAIVVSDLSVVTMIASVLILAVSLIQYSNNDAVNAEQHHRCGLEINELRAQLRSKATPVSAADLADFARSYSHVLDKYSVNHDPVDYDRYHVEHPDAYKLRATEKFAIHARSLSKAHWPNVLMAAIFAFAVFLIFWHVIPARISTNPPPPNFLPQSN